MPIFENPAVQEVLWTIFHNYANSILNDAKRNDTSYESYGSDQIDIPEETTLQFMSSGGPLNSMMDYEPDMVSGRSPVNHMKNYFHFYLKKMKELNSKLKTREHESVKLDGLSEDTDGDVDESKKDKLLLDSNSNFVDDTINRIDAPNDNHDNTSDNPVLAEIARLEASGSWVEKLRAQALREQLSQGLSDQESPVDKEPQPSQRGKGDKDLSQHVMDTALTRDGKMLDAALAKAYPGYIPEAKKKPAVAPATPVAPQAPNPQSEKSVMLKMDALRREKLLPLIYEHMAYPDTAHQWQEEVTDPKTGKKSMKRRTLREEFPMGLYDAPQYLRRGHMRPEDVRNPSSSRTWFERAMMLNILKIADDYVFSKVHGAAAGLNTESGKNLNEARAFEEWQKEMINLVQQRAEVDQNVAAEAENYIAEVRDLGFNQFERMLGNADVFMRGASYEQSRRMIGKDWHELEDSDIGHIANDVKGLYSSGYRPFYGPHVDGKRSVKYRHANEQELVGDLHNEASRIRDRARLLQTGTPPKKFEQWATTFQGKAGKAPVAPPVAAPEPAVAGTPAMPVAARIQYLIRVATHFEKSGQFVKADRIDQEIQRLTRR